MSRWVVPYDCVCRIVTSVHPTYRPSYRNTLVRTAGGILRMNNILTYASGSGAVLYNPTYTLVRGSYADGVSLRQASNKRVARPKSRLAVDAEWRLDVPIPSTHSAKPRAKENAPPSAPLSYTFRLVIFEIALKILKCYQHGADVQVPTTFVACFSFSPSYPLTPLLFFFRNT